MIDTPLAPLGVHRLREDAEQAWRAGVASFGVAPETVAALCEAWQEAQASGAAAVTTREQATRAIANIYRYPELRALNKDTSDSLCLYSDLPQSSKDALLLIHCLYHIRNVEHHQDGSRGKIRATPREFLGALADAFVLGSRAQESRSEAGCSKMEIEALVVQLRDALEAFGAKGKEL